MYFLTWWFLELPYCDGKMWLVLFMALFDKGALFLLAFTFRWCALALSPRHCVVTPVWTTWLRLPGPSSRTQLRSTRCSLTSIGLISITCRSASTAVCVSCAYLLLYISVFFLNKAADCSLCLPAFPSGTGILGLSVWRPFDPEAGARL